MIYLNQPSLLMISSSTISFFLMLHARKQKESQIAINLCWIMMATTIWSFFYGLEVASVNLTIMKVLNVFSYFGISTITVFWFIFAARYSGSDQWLTPLNTKLFFVIPAFIIMMVATNDLHYLYYSNVEFSSTSIYYFQKIDPGLFYWVHVFYSYFFFFSGLVLLIRMFLYGSSQTRLHTVLFITASIFPLVVNLFYLIGFKPYGFLDLTPVAFLFTGIVLSIGVFAIKLFDVNPLALDMLFNHIPDAIIVLDVENKIISANPVGKVFLKSIFISKNTDFINQEKSFKGYKQILPKQYDKKELEIGDKVYFNNSKEIKNQSGQVFGKLIVLRDITEQKYNEKIKQVIFNISQMTNSDISLSELCQGIHRQLAKLLDTANFYIALLNEKDDTVYFPYYIDSFQMIQHPVSFRHLSLVNHVISTGLPICANKEMIENDPDFQPYRYSFGDIYKSWLGVPLKIKDKIIGAIVVQNYTDPNCYSKRDIRLLEMVSTQISIAIKRKKDEESLSKSQQEFASLFQSNPEATVYTDEKGNILNVNSRFTELFGYSLEELEGKNIDTGLIQSPDKIQEAQQLTIKGLNREYLGFETIRKKKDGTLFPVYISGSPVMIGGKQKGVIGTYYDITERKKVEKQLQELSRIDTLTGCFNRRYGLELLDRQVKLSQRNRSPLLLGFLDINNFKAINDYFGHQEGDQALKEVAHLFRSTLREVDIVCRMGGDEFLLVFPDNSLKEALLIRERLEGALSQLNHQIQKNYQIQFSIGFSEFDPKKPKSLDELIAIADQKMYQEKKLRKKNVGEN